MSARRAAFDTFRRRLYCPPHVFSGMETAMSFLGIDIGTSGTKALLLSQEGDVLATAESPHPLLTPKPGWTEQRPEDWWSAVRLATQAVLRKAGVKGRKRCGKARGTSGGDGHWAFRANAWIGLPGRRGPRATASAFVE
jgi:hypothetical protein